MGLNRTGAPERQGNSRKTSSLALPVGRQPRPQRPRGPFLYMKIVMGGEGARGVPKKAEKFCECDSFEGGPGR